MIELNFGYYTKRSNLAILRQKKQHGLGCQKNMYLSPKSVIHHLGDLGEFI